MHLSRKNLEAIQSTGTEIPEKEIFNLPEKILQFGTGVLLRALPDYFVDKANRKGIFNGRILVVKSTATGDAGIFQHQDGMYTLSIRGIEDGVSIDQQIICSAISRVLSAADHWADIIECCCQPAIADCYFKYDGSRGAIGERIHIPGTTRFLPGQIAGIFI